ncbi:530_t:CDS:2 [Funneliformis caledonium]|uniref:530_t:CDS:1 n=1 Tax=Funneliformis caledonium TaxID=1117310 RepID=A0A9N9BRV5_9GLOM|nr:530_t:CDS:2 [Funneliformis caledonium]
MQLFQNTKTPSRRAHLEKHRNLIFKETHILLIHDSSSFNIHIIAITAQKLPDQLEFRNPHPLLIGSGSIWDFQASIALREKLKDAIHDHYKFWKAGQREKTKIPEYFILAGAEEGKSRTAQELPRLLIECADSDADLQNRLKDALVFNLSFENGTKLIRGDEITSSKAICNRMLFQLLKLPNDSWNDFKNRYDVTPEDVLRRIAKHRTQEFKDLNVIIILDGLQVAMDDTKDGKNKSKNLFFYDCISTLGILSLTGPFVIVCCTATISIPIHDFLASSQQKRIFLPVTSSQPPKINNIPVFNDSSTMNMFIDDMGGHGRALEALGEAVVNKDMNKLNYIDLINNVRMNLTYNYSGWLTKTAYLRPLLRIILAHTSVNKDQTIFELDGQRINVDDVIQFGLVRFESSDPDRVVGYLSWIMAHAYHENINDPLLRNWDFAYYNEVLNESGEPSIPPGCQYWQHFEYFVAQFRSLKSNIYNYDQRVDLSVIHNGATHNLGQVSISNRQLTLSKSVERISTKSKDYRNQNANILCQKGRVNLTNASHIIINASAAKFGDSFCSIYMAETKQLQTEAHQCKLLREQSISQKIYEEEYNKATSSGDIFILYTSESCQNLELQPMSAIVNKENWKEYFGPFAGRCYNYAMGPPDINKATFTQLTGIEKIAKKRARIIMEERDRVEFFDIDDCERRTIIPRQYIEPFFLKG